MKTKRPTYVTARADVKVNQHAPKFGDKRTKRNRDRSAMRRTAIAQAA